MSNTQPEKHRIVINGQYVEVTLKELIQGYTENAQHKQEKETQRQKQLDDINSLSTIALMKARRVITGSKNMSDIKRALDVVKTVQDVVVNSNSADKTPIDGLVETLAALRQSAPPYMPVKD